MASVGLLLKKAWCHCCLLYAEFTKAQKNVFQVITLFAFKIPHRNAPTIAVNSQPLSTFTHCEETCPLQVRYYPKEKHSTAPQPINPLAEEVQLPHLELSQVSVTAQSQRVHRDPLRNTTSHLPCGARAALGYLHLLIPLTSKEAQGWCRLRHQPSSEISCSSRS